MASQIRPTRLEVSDRFPMLGFTIRTDGTQKKCEVAVATDASLFSIDGKPHRSRDNFYSSRAVGPVVAARGEAVYVLPAEALARFAGQSKLYFALASYADGNGSTPELSALPTEASPYVSLKGLTGRSLRRVRVLPSRQQVAAGYGGRTGRELEWAGDMVVPGTQAVIGGPTTPATAKPNGNGSAAAGAPKARATAFDYDDGYGPLPAPGSDTSGAVASDDDVHDIGGPIPDDSNAPASATALSGGATPDYPQASRFAAAASSNYRAVSGTRNISRVVIHITDGGANINGTIGWFQNPSAKVSAHYVVGQDGEVVQMVRNNDVAWHAGSANGDSIGIEHVANTKGLVPTSSEYCASAALTRWLCDQFGIPIDRSHILGHSEADPKTTHKGCPNAVWDWDYFMGMVESQTCYEPGAGGDVKSGDSQQAPASSEGLAYTSTKRRPAPAARPRPLVRPLEVVQQDYNPGNRQDALRMQLDFQNRYQQWIAGVSDTSFFPHSAICQLVRDDGGAGTGFYVTTDRILTAAHVVEGANSITVIPGKNGGTGADGPFGHFSVSASDWVVHPNRVVGNENNDIAVLKVSTPPPAGQCFDILEELRQSLPSNIIVCGYSAQSSDPAVTASIDPDKQHLDGDYIRTLSDGTFQYNLQTLAGASGSPVYYVWGREDEQRQMSVIEVHLVGVHVSAFSGSLNQGCRLTDDKIAWINSLGRDASAGAQAFSYVSPRARALDQPTLEPGDVVKVRGKTYIVYANEIRCGGVYAWIDNNPGNITAGKWTEDHGAFPGKKNGAFAIFPDEDTGFAAIIAYIERFPEDSIYRLMCRYAPPDDGKTPLLKGNNPQAYADAIARKLGVPTTTQIKELSDEQKSIYATEIQRIETGANGSGKIYTYDDPELPDEVKSRLPPPAATSDGTTDNADIGSAATGQSLGTSIEVRKLRPRALGNESFTLNWDEVELVPQPNNVTCWATSAAMVIGWRDQMSLSPQTIAQIASRSTKTGLDPSERRKFAAEIGLEYEEPQSYTIDAFRDLLEAYGPLWVGARTPLGNHAIVVTGMYGDGAGDGSDTYLRIADPWDRDAGTPGSPGAYRNTHIAGSRYILAWQEFVREYEQRATTAPDGTVNAQILHAGGTNGRQPNRGQPADYAMAMVRAQTKRLPPPPLRKVRSRAFDAATTIANASITAVTGSTGKVSWQLDQLQGFKTLDDQPFAPSPRLAAAAPIRLTDWPFLENDRGERISANFVVDWQYDGKALGNIAISNVGARDAQGYALQVTARVSDVANASPQQAPTYAALRVNFVYCFTRAGAPDVNASIELQLFGDGTYEQMSRWEARAA